jgi:tetratricopeptide (TPR) repeat protein
MEPVTSVDMKEIGQSVNAIKSAWNEKDYARVADQCRKLLEHEPENVYGLIYLARAAAYTEDWPDVVHAGWALTRRSPREAFNAARKLNHAGQVREAARIFSDLDIRPDWFDAKIADMAWKEGVSLLKSGQTAANNNDVESAKIIWMAGVRIAPRSQLLRDRVSAFALEARQVARRQDREKDLAGYIRAWREVLWFNPTDVLAASKVAQAYERTNEKEAIVAWLKVLAIDPEHQTASERLRKLVSRHDLEDHAIRAMVEVGRDENTDPLIAEFAENRNAKASATLEKALKARRREALNRARGLDRTVDPRGYLEAWKNVLVLNPEDLSAAKKVVSCASALRDHSELVDGLIAHLNITPGVAALGERLANAALRAGQEERALEYLARHGMADLLSSRVVELQKRVLRAGKNAMRAFDFDHALSCFNALELADRENPALEALRPMLAKRAASNAKEAEREGNLVAAVPLAEKVLQIVPDQPTALGIVARDLWRHKRFGDLVDLCAPRVKPGPEYASVQRLLDQSAAKMAA